jgi:hypothetical protein
MALSTITDQSYAALVAAGLLLLKRGALWLTIVVSVLNILSAAPGLAFAPTPTLRVLATVGVGGFAVVILLAVLPGSRRVHKRSLR